MAQSLKKEELKKMIDEDEKFVLINVLSPKQFNEAHIPKSVNIPIGEDFKKNIKQKYPDKDKKIVVYCASFECHASTKAAKELEELGYNNVYDYEGGIADWKEASYPLKKKKNSN